MRKTIEFFNSKFNKINFDENPADKDDEMVWLYATNYNNWRKK